MDAKIKVFFVLTKCLIKNIFKRSLFIGYIIDCQIIKHRFKICYSLLFLIYFLLSTFSIY